MKKRQFLAACSLALALGSISPSFAAEQFPAREVKLIIPFAPGGATDVVFRVISEAAEAHLGKSIVPMNMGGAGGSKGSTFVKGQKADGYTLLGGHEFMMTTHYGGMVDFGLEAFEPVCTLAATPFTVTAGTHTPYKSYPELIDYVKKNPGKVVLGMTPASVQYVFWSEVARTAGFDMNKAVRVVIINGSGPQVKAILGKHIDMVSGDVPSNIEYVKDGRMQFLAVSNQNRVPQIPNVPTQKELGYDVNLAVTRAVFAPKGTPKDVVDKIAKAYEMACKDPAVIKKIEELGNEMLYLNAQQTKEHFGKLNEIYKAAFAQQK